MELLNDFDCSDQISLLLRAIRSRPAAANVVRRLQLIDDHRLRG